MATEEQLITLLAETLKHAGGVHETLRVMNDTIAKQGQIVSSLTTAVGFVKDELKNVTNTLNGQEGLVAKARLLTDQMAEVKHTCEDLENKIIENETEKTRGKYQVLAAGVSGLFSLIAIVLGGIAFFKKSV